MTAFEEVRVIFRIANVTAHLCIPPVGDGHKLRVESRAEDRHRIRKRITEVFVFAAAETMPAHHDAAAKDGIIRVQSCERLAFLGGKQRSEHGTSLIIHVSFDPCPIEKIDSFGDCWEGRSHAQFHVIFRKVSR